MFITCCKSEIIEKRQERERERATKTLSSNFVLLECVKGRCLCALFVEMLFNLFLSLNFILLLNVMLGIPSAHVNILYVIDR